MPVLLALAPLLAALVSPAEAADAAPFTRRDLATAFPVVQDAVPVRLGEGAARHLLVVTSPDDDGVAVELFPPDETGAPATHSMRLDLPEDVVAFDVATIRDDGREALYFLTPRAVLRFDPERKSLREERRVTSIYRRPVPGRLLTPDFMRSQEDGPPLLVLPDFDGVHVGDDFLPVAPRTTHDEWGPAYRPPPLAFADLGGDEQEDAFLISDDALHVFHRKPAGFSDVAVVHPLGLDLESGPVDESLGEIDQSDLTIRRVVAIEDFDGDEIVDLLVESSHREGVFDRTTRYELFYGRREDGRVAFGGAPATGVGLDTAIGGVRTVDIDGDGRRDLAAGSIDFGLGSIVSALLTGAVDVDVRFYRLSEENRFPEQPSTTRDARIEFDLSQGRASIPVFVLADVDGDGAKDLVVREDEDELRVYRGDGSRGVFSGEPREVALPLPENGQLVTAARVDGDPGEDLIVRYGVLDGKDARRRLALLLGRS